MWKDCTAGPGLADDPLAVIEALGLRVGPDQRASRFRATALLSRPRRPCHPQMYPDHLVALHCDVQRVL